VRPRQVIGPVLFAAAAWLAAIYAIALVQGLTP
jgi:hypothetical protein